MKSLDLVPTKQVSTNSKQKWINCYIKSRKKQRYYKELVFPNYRVTRIHIRKNCKENVEKNITTASIIWLVRMIVLHLKNYGPLLKSKDVTTVELPH